jgi:hypothetical protein
MNLSTTKGEKMNYEYEIYKKNEDTWKVDIFYKGEHVHSKNSFYSKLEALRYAAGLFAGVNLCKSGYLNT